MHGNDLIGSYCSSAAGHSCGERNIRNHLYFFDNVHLRKYTFELNPLFKMTSCRSLQPKRCLINQLINIISRQRAAMATGACALVRPGAHTKGAHQGRAPKQSKLSSVMRKHHCCCSFSTIRWFSNLLAE